MSASLYFESTQAPLHPALHVSPCHRRHTVSKSKEHEAGGSSTPGISAGIVNSAFQDAEKHSNIFSGVCRGSGLQRPGVRGSVNLSVRPASRLGGDRSVPPNSSRSSMRQLGRSTSGERRRSSLVVGRRPSQVRGCCKRLLVPASASGAPVKGHSEIMVVIEALCRVLYILAALASIAIGSMIACQVQFGRPGASPVGGTAGRAPAGDKALAAADRLAGPSAAAGIPLPALVDALIAVSTPALKISVISKSRQIHPAGCLSWFRLTQRSCINLLSSLPTCVGRVHTTQAEEPSPHCHADRWHLRDGAVHQAACRHADAQRHPAGCRGCGAGTAGASISNMLRLQHSC